MLWLFLLIAFTFRSKCDTTEEQQLEEEFKNLFPSFHDEDFADYQQRDLTDDVNEPTKMVDAPVISAEDIEFIASTHTKFVSNYTKTEWLNPVKDKHLRTDFIRPLLEKFKLFKLVLDKATNALNYTVDQDVIGSLSVLVAVAQNYGEVDIESDVQGSPSRSPVKKKYNFYKDANVDEVKTSYFILDELKVAVKGLLDQWPEHPALKTVSINFCCILKHFQCFQLIYKIIFGYL